MSFANTRGPATKYVYQTYLDLPTRPWSYQSLDILSLLLTKFRQLLCNRQFLISRIVSSFEICKFIPTKTLIFFSVFDGSMLQFFLKIKILEEVDEKFTRGKNSIYGRMSVPENIIRCNRVWLIYSL